MTMEIFSKIAMRIFSAASCRRRGIVWPSGGKRERKSWAGEGKGLTTVLSVTAHNSRLPFPISSPACNRVAATSVDRISSFCRSGFLRFPPLISIFLRIAGLFTTSVFFSVFLPSLSLSLSLPAATTVTGITEKPRETKITDVPSACGGRDSRRIASPVERTMSGTPTRGEIDREGEDVGYVARRLERERTGSSDSIPLYRLVMQILRRRDKAGPLRCPTHSPPLPSPSLLAARSRTHAGTHACVRYAGNIGCTVATGWRAGGEERNEENERTFCRKQ